MSALQTIKFANRWSTSPTLASMKIAVVALLALGSPRESSAAVDLSNWGNPHGAYRTGDERCNAPGGGGSLPFNWEVQPSLTAVKTPDNNNCTALLAGDLSIQDSSTTVTLRVDSSGGDNDYVGLAIGYDRGDLDNLAADYFVLIWQKESGYGLRLLRVVGSPDPGAIGDWIIPPGPTFSGVTLVGGPAPIGGWVHDVSYTFRIVFTRTRLSVRISENGGPEMLQFNTLASDLGLAQFDGGGLAFFNFSQKAAFYQDVFTARLECGDGFLNGVEECDDEGTTNGDGCSASCLIESGYTCAGEPSVCTLFPTYTPTASPTSTVTPTPTLTSTPTPTPCGSDGSLCDDGVFCNGTDTCSGGMCSVHSGNPCTTQCNAMCQEATHSCFDPSGTPCSDADACTLYDVCNGTGACVGQNLAGTYAVLRWPPMPTSDVDVQVGKVARVNDDVCADFIRIGNGAEICGDAVSPKTTGTAVSIGLSATVSGQLVHARVDGTVVTGGGSVRHPERCYKAPMCGASPGMLPPCDIIGDPPGSQPFLDACNAASCKVTARRSAFAALPPDLNEGCVRLGRNEMKTIPSSGTLGSGQVVIDVGAIKVGQNSTLQLVGGPTTQQVIVRVQSTLGPCSGLTPGDFRLGRSANFSLDGLTADQVVVVVDGKAALGSNAHMQGTLFSGKGITTGRETTVDGALIGGKDMRIGRNARVNLHPFVGW